jgi:hypothetical protein
MQINRNVKFYQNMAVSMFSQKHELNGKLKILVIAKLATYQIAVVIH